MKLKLLLGIALFFLAFAFQSLHADAVGCVIKNESANTGNFTGACTLDGGHITCGAGQAFLWKGDGNDRLTNLSTNTNSTTLTFYNWSTAVYTSWGLMFKIQTLNTSDDPASVSMFHLQADGTNSRTILGNAGINDDEIVYSGTGGMEFAIELNSNMNFSIFINGTRKASIKAYEPEVIGNVTGFRVGRSSASQATEKFRGWAETNGTYTDTCTAGAVPDTTFPIVNTTFNITSPRINDIINFTANITDETGLLSANWTINMTGGTLFFNNTYGAGIVKTEANNKTKIIGGRGNVYNFTLFVTDTSNNVKQNSTLITVADTLGFIQIGLNMSSIRINDVVNVSGNITDIDGNIAHGWVTYNNSGGSVTNNTFTLSGFNANFSQAVAINLTRANVWNFTVYYNDTYGTTLQNSTIFTILNTNPTAPEIFNTTNKHYNTNITINITPSTDADSDILTYFWFRNKTGDSYPNNVQKGTATSYTTNETSEGGYFYFVNVSDGVINITGALWNWTLDTSIPTFTNNNLTNNTFNNKNMTIFFTCNDNDIFNSSGNLSNATHTFQFKYNDTPFSDNTKLNIILALNLTGLKDGNYTYTESCGDTHSEPISQNSTSKGKKGESELIFNDTKLGKEINFKVFFREKDSKLTDTSATLKSYADYLPNGFLGFGVNFTVVKPETKIAFNISTNQGNIQIINSSYKSHLRSSPYGIDFNGTLSVNGIDISYTTTTTRISEKEVEVLVMSSILLAGGDVVVFQSKTLFGLNEPKQDFNIVVDNAVPAFSSRTPLNDSALTSANVQLNISINETYSQNFSLSANFSGTYKLNYSGGYASGSVIIHNVTLEDGVYIYSWTANDSSGNANTTQNFTFTIDSTPPIITLQNPFNNTVITDIEKPNVNFRISSNENVKNCSLFLSNSLVGNESTQKQSHNFTINSISAGNHKWNATCYDSSNNIGASKIFNLEIKLISGGASSTPESAGGGGIGTPPPIEEEGEIIEKGYTMTYICQKVGKFINGTPSYNLNDIVLLQEDIRWDMGIIIPFTTLSNYVDDYDNFCGKKKPLSIAQAPKNNQSLGEAITDIGNRFNKITGLNIGSYFRLPFNLDFGKLKDTDSNAKGFFDFINVFMPLSVSDGLSDTPNIVWEGGVRIVPLLVLGGLIIAVAVFRKIAKSRKNLDFLANPDNIKKENK